MSCSVARCTCVYPVTVTGSVLEQWPCWQRYCVEDDADISAGHAVTKRSHLWRSQGCEGQAETPLQEAFLLTPGRHRHRHQGLGLRGPEGLREACRPEASGFTDHSDK